MTSSQPHLEQRKTQWLEYQPFEDFHEVIRLLDALSL